MTDLVSLPRFSVKGIGRPNGAAKCDGNLLQFVKEQVRPMFPNLALTQKSALEFALLE